MAFYTCNRYRIIVLILIALIIFQIIRLLSDKPVAIFSGSDLLKLEDDTYNKHKKDKVKVRVYYEALCPDSKFFFLKHLGPVTEKLSDFLDITLIPYGKAMTTEDNGKYSFHCQHGEEECFGNKVHACAIELIGNMTEYVQFTDCLFSDFDVDTALKMCSNKFSVDKDQILSCANSQHGSELLKKYGDDTHIIEPSFIPTILINGSKNNQGGILKNFLLEVCKQIDMPLPPPCL